MKKLITLLGIFACLSCSKDLCESQASCIAGPGGSFDEEKINVSFERAIIIIENGISTGSIPIDSIEVKDYQRVYFDDNYFSNWIAFDKGSEVDFILFYAGESVFEFSVIDNFPTEVGGYIFTATQENEDVSLKFYTASESFIDGICKDIIKCTD